MHLGAAAPSAAAALKNIHIVGTQPTLIFGAPHAVGVLRLIEEHLPVEGLQLLHCVDVEYQQSAGRDEQPQPIEGAAHILGICQVIEAVKAADGGIHRTVEIQFLHLLLQEKRRNTLHRAHLTHGLHEHLLAGVHSDHLIAAACEDPRHSARTAGKIQHLLDRDLTAPKQPLNKVRPFFIPHIVGQSIIAAG